MGKAKEKAAKETPNKNMELWDKVFNTDPKHTKQVSQRGGFTTVCAQYQVQLATEQWGKYGETWGLQDCLYTVNEYDKLREIVLDAIFYYPDGKFEISSDMTYKPGNECRKKLRTDVQSKSLSLLGFNADVFMGLYDDNKYVAEQHKAHADKTKATTAVETKPKPSPEVAEPVVPYPDVPEPTKGTPETDTGASGGFPELPAKPDDDKLNKYSYGIGMISSMTEDTGVKDGKRWTKTVSIITNDRFPNGVKMQTFDTKFAAWLRATQAREVGLYFETNAKYKTNTIKWVELAEVQS